MSTKQKKKKNKKRIRRTIIAVLMPFLPFLIIIFLLFFSICTIIDAIFVQEVQSDNTVMSVEQVELKEQCIEKSEYLNTCNNFIGEESTPYLLDVDNRENSKLLQWSHLYAIMAFNNMAMGKKLDESLLNEVSEHFKSTFIYEKVPVIVEITTTDENEEMKVEIQEEFTYILKESNSIIGHYIYHYEEKTIENGNMKIKKQTFVREELIGEKYERLKKYLKEELNIRESDIEKDVEVIIQAANGYYEGDKNLVWLQGTLGSNTIITDGKGLIPKGMFIWPVPGYTSITSPFGMRTHPITGAYKLHTGTDIGAPTGANFIAMADGTVIKAGYDSAYGNMVMIDHRKWNYNIICTWF